MEIKMIKLETQEERIADWKKVLLDFSQFSHERMLQIEKDYLHEVWKIQEINGDLPIEFKGMQ
jgi:hypothetical protein